MLKINDKAPNFKLKNQNEKELSLKDYSGKWLVLYFYPKDNTPGCTTEACDFTASLAEYKKNGASIVGISPDSTASHKNFTLKYKLNIDLLSDPEKKTVKAYGAWGKKKNYGKEYEGLIRSTFLINPKGKISQIWSKVKVRVKGKNKETCHVDVVRDKLKELR
tara:strand:- start:1824 stop:2312 length:489 start_codon:yes stop_codon:yes gene_type:complete